MLFFRRSSSKLPDEAELLRHYRASGDLAVLGRLFERYMPFVFGVCLKYLRDDDESKDATMQVFEKLIVELRLHEVKHFNGWLHTLVRNHCLMLLRTRQHRASVESIRLATDGDTAFDFALQAVEDDTEHRLLRMEEAMKGLPAEQQTCLELFYLQQKSYKEICELTGYDFKKVKSFIQNGKRNLKIYLDKAE